MPGQWSVKFYLDGQLQFTDTFTITGSPTPTPTATPTASPSPTPTPTQTPTPGPATVTITLQAGWNVFPYLGSSMPVPNALAPISGKFEVVYGLKGAQQDWDSFDPDAPPFLSELQQLQQYAAYIILMTAGGSLTFNTPSSPPAALPTFYPGWNLFSYLGATKPVGEALAPLNGRYQAAYSLNAEGQDWDSYDPSAPPFLSELQQLQQYHAYVINVSPGDGGAR